MAKIKKMRKTRNKISKQLLQSNNRKVLGFTLIELMITVAIVGVLASVVYPSYISFITKSNRSEGQRELLRFANLQEQFFVDFRTYSDDLTTLGESTASIATEHGYYTISVTDSDAAGFTLNATAEGRQADNDTSCSPLTIDQVGAKGPAGCWD